MSENHFIPNSYHSIKNFFNVAILFFSFKYALRLIALELMRIMEMEEGISWFGQKYRSRLRGDGRGGSGRRSERGS